MDVDDVDDVDDPVVAEVVRNEFVESTHRGRVVALAASGEPILSRGPVAEPVLLRSCAKPLQAVGMVRLGLDLDGPHLAIASASHDGTELHRELAHDVLTSVGLDETALDNTPALPLEPRSAALQRLAGGPDRLGHNCSGKHAAMLATCVVNGWPIAGYLEPTHPFQQALLATCADLAGEPVTHVAVDGCGAPIGAVSLVGMARAYARLATADTSSPEGRIAASMRSHPEVIGGEARDVTRLMRAVPGLVAKDGAEGCYAVALPDGRAVALKVADGAQRLREPLVVAGLRWLGVADGTLDGLGEAPVLGHGRPVGAIHIRL
jgi:L-asparaginase II